MLPSTASQSGNVDATRDIREGHRESSCIVGLDRSSKKLVRSMLRRAPSLPFRGLFAARRKHKLVLREELVEQRKSREPQC